MQIRPALTRTLTAHRPVIMYGTAAVAWAAAITAAVRDVDTDAMLVFAVAALASAIIAFQHAMLTRQQQASDAARKAAETLNRAVLSRPHDRDHEVTGPYAIVSSLPGRSARSARQ